MQYWGQIDSRYSRGIPVQDQSYVHACVNACCYVWKYWGLFFLVFFLPGWTSQWHCWIVFRLILCSWSRKMPGACWVTTGTSVRLDDHLPGCHTTEDDSGPPLSVDIWGNCLLLNKFHHWFMLVESCIFWKERRTPEICVCDDNGLCLWEEQAASFVAAFVGSHVPQNIVNSDYGFNRCRTVTVNFSCDFTVLFFQH